MNLVRVVSGLYKRVTAAFSVSVFTVNNILCDGGVFGETIGRIFDGSANIFQALFGFRNRRAEIPDRTGLSVHRTLRLVYGVSEITGTPGSVARVVPDTPHNSGNIPGLVRNIIFSVA